MKKYIRNPNSLFTPPYIKPEYTRVRTSSEGAISPSEVKKRGILRPAPVRIRPPLLSEVIINLDEADDRESVKNKFDKNLNHLAAFRKFENSRTDDHQIHLINQNKLLNARLEILQNSVNDILASPFQNLKEAMSLFNRALVFYLHAEIPFLKKINFLTQCLSNLFSISYGRSYFSCFYRFMSDNQINLIGIIAQNDKEFSFYTKLLKDFIIALAVNYQEDFWLEGGFSPEQRQLLNLKRGYFAFIESYFAIESRSIKICRNLNLLN